MNYLKGKKHYFSIAVVIIFLVAAAFITQKDLNSFAASNMGTVELKAGNKWTSNHENYQQFLCTISNTGTSDVKNWKVEIPVNSDCKVSQSWNASYSLSSNVLTFSNSSYNGSIVAKDTTQFGIILMNAEIDSSNAVLYFDGSIVSETVAVTPTPIETTPIETTDPTPETEKPITMDISDHSLPSNYSSYISSNTYGTFTSFTYYSDITKTKRPANIILPHNYSEDKKYPVLYMLHGIGGNENAWGSGNSCSLLTMAGNLFSDGKAEEMIIVMPHIRVSNSPETNMFSAENYQYYDLIKEELVQNLMPYMEQHYSIKTGRENTAVAGFSMGGRESLYVGISRPDLFGYTGAFCPAPGIFENANLNVKEMGLFPSEGAFTIADQYKNNTVTMIVKGTADTVVGDFPLNYHTALSNNKVPHYYYQVDGGHEEKVWGHGYYNFLQRIFGKTVE